MNIQGKNMETWDMRKKTWEKHEKKVPNPIIFYLFAEMLLKNLSDSYFVFLLPFIVSRKYGIITYGIRKRLYWSDNNGGLPGQKTINGFRKRADQTCFSLFAYRI